MNLDNLHTHYVLLEERGFITNCPPKSELSIWHDEVSKYCEHLNELALSRGDYFEPPFDSMHLNEPVGDYITIYKVKGQNFFRQNIGYGLATQPGEYISFKHPFGTVVFIVPLVNFS